MPGRLIIHVEFDGDDHETQGLNAATLVDDLVPHLTPDATIGGFAYYPVEPVGSVTAIRPWVR